MLPFAYPIRVGGAGISSADDVSLAKAFIKYEVSAVATFRVPASAHVLFYRLLGVRIICSPA